MANLPPEAPRNRWNWGLYNRPYRGCGCLYTLITFLILWWLIALVIPPLAVWDAWLFMMVTIL